MDELRTLIRSARKKRGWTRARLAEEASSGDYEVSDDMIVRLEVSCQRVPQPEVLRAVARALGLPMSEIRQAIGLA